MISLMPKEEKEIVRVASFLLSISFFFFCCVLLYHFDKSEPGFQYAFDIPLIPEYHLYLSFGLDGISFCFLLLTAFIIPICLFACQSIELNYKQFIIYVLLIEIFLVISFCVTNLLFFYVFFESVLIPMFIIIGV